MSNVYYQPWIGKQYEMSVFGKRILILGESHYQSEPRITGNWNQLTIECVSAQIGGDYKKQFWTNIFIALRGEYPSVSNKVAFWHSVAFYNYVQQSVGKGPRIAPGTQMWRSSEAAFLEVLIQLKPQILLVLGYRLWRNLPGNYLLGPVIPNEKQPETRWYPYEGGSCLAYGIRHPSSGFNGRYWYPHIQQVICFAE